MKKILVHILLGVFIFITGSISITQNTYADEGVSSVKIEVTENVPGANCSEKGKDLWECDLGTGFGAVMSVVGKMINYATFIAGLAGVLFIVINGILYSMSGMDAGMKDEAKKRIVKTLLGLVVLLLSGLILNAIAPWVYVV